jgi:hypothetical protein
MGGGLRNSCKVLRIIKIEREKRGWGFLRPSGFLPVFAGFCRWFEKDFRVLPVTAAE